MKIKCTKCGNEQAAHAPDKVPNGTVRIESNYCPNCDGDFYEEEFFDENDKQIIKSNDRI